jgi:hypothetical protein
VRTVQRLKKELPPEAQIAITDHIIIHDLVIPRLKTHSDLSGLHALFSLNSVTKRTKLLFCTLKTKSSCICRLVTTCTDKQETSKKSIDESITSLTTAYFTQKKNKWPSCGRFMSTQSCLPIKKNKDNEPLQRLPTPVWDKILKEAREKFLQEQRMQQGNQPRNLGNRGSGGLFHHSQRAIKNDSKHETDMTESTQSGIECFNTEIPCTISGVSEFASEHDIAQENAPITSQEPVKPITV